VGRTAHNHNLGKGDAVMNTRTYRLLIVLSFAFLGLSVLAHALGSGRLPTELQVYLSQSQRPTTGVGMVASLIYLGGVVVSAVGLYCFKSWARPMAVTLTLGTFVVEPLLGPRVLSGLAGALLDLEILSWGMVLALSYWSPLAGQFRAHGSAA